MKIRFILGVKADLAKGKRSFPDKIKELKKKLTIQKKKVVELKESIKFISSGLDKLQ